MENPKPLPALNETGHVPEYFADGISGTNWNNGILKLSFESLRACHDEKPYTYRVAVCKVAFPIAIAEHVAKLILDAVEKSKAKPADTDTVAQKTIN